MIHVLSFGYAPAVGELLLMAVGWAPVNPSHSHRHECVEVLGVVLICSIAGVQVCGGVFEESVHQLLEGKTNLVGVEVDVLEAVGERVEVWGAV